MMQFPRGRWAVPFLALGVLAVAGCDDDDPVGPDEGTLRVVVTATGAPADADGFTVLVDGTEIGELTGAGGTLADELLEEGEYEVELSGVAANCTVGGENPRTVTITDGDITTTTFAVTCAADAGTVSISTTTTGDNPDPNGFQVSVAGGAPQAIGATGTLDVSDVASGDVEVELTDIAANCAVTGDNPMTVTVTAQGTTPAAFTVTCALNTGNAAVAFTTTGTNPDTDGYTLTVDGGTPITVSDVNGTITVPSLAAGDRAFSLGGVAANCAVTGGANQTVTITDRQTADVTYTITCT